MSKMESKKISFGFNKTSRKLNIISSNVKQEEKKVELIDCLEAHSIKIKDAIEEVKEPLIIPVKDNQKNLLDRMKEIKKKREKSQNDELEDTRLDSELSADELAARQLIREAKERLSRKNPTNNSKVSVLPLNQETLTFEGEKEPTLEDYESVPISDYGLAVLRGMGWKDGMPIGKNVSKSVPMSIPELRPKGLGLGASKIVLSEMPKQKSVDKDGKELILIKGAFAKVIAGAQKGYYCEIQGFDEEAGRVIVKLSPKGEVLNVNELMLIPVTKDEFLKGSKILNNAKYEEYKEISDKKLDSYKIKHEISDSKNVKKEINEDSKKVYQSSDHKNNKSVAATDNTGTSRRDGHSRSKYKSESESDEEKTIKRRNTSKYKDRSRSRSISRDKKRTNRQTNRRRSDSSTSEDREKEKKSHKHTKSKYPDKSRSPSVSRERYRKKNKKHKTKQRKVSSSSQDSDYEDKRKSRKNKCKSRHRRNSSDDDKKSYRNKP